MTVLTVKQVNRYIKALLEEIPQIKNVYISGEISNFKHYYQKGHMYFTLKDEDAQLKCVMFSSDNDKLKFRPENGMKVICFGQIGVYERDGVYQLYVHDMHLEGIGSLTVAYEQLKDRLEKEGLFSEQNKKAIKKYPEKIGVVTSNIGAAVEDIKNILKRRFPLCDVIIVPTVVQGDSAPDDIVKSIEFLDSMGDIDTIIVGRGGGSIEDLWAFNTESVARAVFRCKTPVISAVGHETDFTICDFVADLRAPTPSAAAELAVPDIESERLLLQNLSASLEASLNYKLERYEEKLKNIRENSALSNVNRFFEGLMDGVNAAFKRMDTAYKNVINSKESRMKGIAYALNALSPLAVLSRGYSIVKKDGKVKNSVSGIHNNDILNLVLSDGTIEAAVTEVNGNE